MDERNGIGGALLCNRSYTPCCHTNRVQERSVESLRGGKAYQATQRLLYGHVRLANGRGTRFPNQHIQRGKCTQCHFRKAVLAKRKASLVGIVKRQTAV